MRIGDLTGLRVLLADDNPTNLLVASRMLEVKGADVTTAVDGQAALDAFEAVEVDLVLLDIEMPRLSGLDVIRSIRGRGDARAETPLIALTAYVMDEHRERILAAGASGIIAKPVTDVEEFARELSTLHAGARPDPPAPPESPQERPDHPRDETPAGIDHSAFDALASAMGPEGMDVLRVRVTGDLRDVAEGIGTAAGIADFATVRARTHVLMSLAGTIGAVRLQGLAEDLNRAAHASDRAEVEELAAQTLAEMLRVVDFVGDQGD